MQSYYWIAFDYADVPAMLHPHLCISSIRIYNSDDTIQNFSLAVANLGTVIKVCE